jgi:hypothetical protein
MRLVGLAAWTPAGGVNPLSPSNCINVPRFAQTLARLFRPDMRRPVFPPQELFFWLNEERGRLSIDQKSRVATKRCRSSSRSASNCSSALETDRLHQWSEVEEVVQAL